MNRSVLVTVALVAGCGSEIGLMGEVQTFPNSGAPPLDETVRTDVITQVTQPKVDILWMVDNSCSMSNEQTDLTTNFPHFMDYFVGSGLDYHVGVTSSDIISSDYSGSDGTLVIKNGIKYIDPTTPDPVNQFTEMASLGIGGSYPERGIGAVYLALGQKRETANIGFYREDAALHTIIISDEPDYTLATTVTQPEFISWYDALKPEPDMRTFSAIIDPDRGEDYVAVANAIGGIVWDLTDGGWPQVLEELGLQASGFKREYFLSQLPVLGTIKVNVQMADGTVFEFLEGVDWNYDSARNSIVFIEYVPESLSKVKITYTMLAGANEEVD